MLHQTFKTLTLFVVCMTVFVGLTNPAHAGVNNVYQSTCAELESTNWEKAPSPMAILCPIARLMNVFVYSAAAFFVMFVFVAAIKYALSQGDPKALQASQQTLTMALVGFLVVIGVWTILTILKNILGLDAGILNPFDTLSKNLARLLEKFGVSAP